ncbi:hypothetical protein [Calothrix sp. UHCC 0171]|uniref:hypothetical protein n=1 Tax=Calothrix sp. UHCC 0171 TaxID=3110245 RepID=UPI002B21C93C|nr:hypothetical protein [Calothrix sp. UHCC 0171]MEA5571077.1 hypothetical protein [Calothrix sp. UHCC 0171]
MSRLVYFGTIALSIFVWHLGRNVAASNLSILNQDTTKTINFATPTANQRVQTKPYLLAGRNEKLENCMRSGNCKD